MYKNFGLAKSKCSHEGCSKKLKGEELSKHEIICKYQRISCPLFAFKKCPEEIRMKDMKDHLLSTHNHSKSINRQWLKIIWLKPGFQGSKKARKDESCFGTVRSLSGQNVFFFLENGSLNKDGLFKVYAFHIDANPEKALKFEVQVEAKKTKEDKMGLKRSGPVNAINGEQNPEHCFTMTSDESRTHQQGGKTVVEFQLLDQQSPKISIWDYEKMSISEFVYKGCKEILKRRQ